MIKKIKLKNNNTKYSIVKKAGITKIEYTILGNNRNIKTIVNKDLKATFGFRKLGKISFHETKAKNKRAYKVSADIKRSPISVISDFIYNKNLKEAEQECLNL